jgi:hypothetical protein
MEEQDLILQRQAADEQERKRRAAEQEATPSRVSTPSKQPAKDRKHGKA